MSGKKACSFNQKFYLETLVTSEFPVYQEAITPDIYSIDADSFNDIEHDKKVLRASKWIQTHDWHISK
jgi:hypothetical protein